MGRVQIKIEVKLSWPTKHNFAGSQKPPTEALKVGEPFPIDPRAMERRTYIKKGSEYKKIFHLLVVLMVTTHSKTPFRPCSRLLNYTVGVELFTGTGLERCRGSANAHFVQFSSRPTTVNYTHLCKSKSKTVRKCTVQAALLWVQPPALGGPGCFLTSQAARGRDPVAASLMENRLYKFCLKKIRFWKWAYRIGWKFACF